MSEQTAPARPSIWLRDVAPALVVLFAVALSAFAKGNVLGPRLGLMPAPLALWLLPAVSVVLYLGIRLSSGPTDRASALLLVWVSVFPSMLHVLHLMFGLGVISSIDRGISLMAGTLHLGFAAILPGLPKGSALGLRLSRTLASEAAWRRTQRILGMGFLVAAAGAFATLALPSKAAFWVFLAGPILAVSIGFAGAFWPRIEEPAAEARPNAEPHNPEDPKSSP